MDGCSDSSARKGMPRLSVNDRFSHSFVPRNFAMAASMFMNSNSLPIALLQSLVVTVPGLTWGDDDNTDAMVGRALTYLVLCSTLGMIVSPYLSTMRTKCSAAMSPCVIDRFDGATVYACFLKPTLRVQSLKVSKRSPLYC